MTAHRHRPARRLHRISALAALSGMLLVSSGFAVMATAGTASAVSAAADCVPSDAYTETVRHEAETHVVRHEAETHVVRHEAETRVVRHEAETHVVRHEAVPAGADLWWSWSPSKTKGRQNYTPAFPNDSRGTWQGPHENGGPRQDTYGTFQTGGGNSPFFHREHGTPGKDAYDETVTDKDAYDEVVTDKEAYDEVVTGKEAYDETVVDKEAYDETVEHPAVLCDEGPKADATVSASTNAAQDCDRPGSFSVTGENIAGSVPASGTHAPGEFDVVVTAESGHVFADGQRTSTLSVSIPFYDGSCGSDETTTTTPSVDFLDDCTTPTVFLPLSDQARSAADSTVVTGPGTEEINGVRYATGGSFAPGGTVTVTATPLEGFAFPEDTTSPSVESRTFKTLEQCTQVSPPTVVDPPVVTPSTVVVKSPAATSRTKTKTTSSRTKTKTTRSSTKASGTQVASTGSTTSATTIPSVVHAGIGGPAAADLAAVRSQQGLSLVGAGALVLLAAGLGSVRRRGARVQA